MSKPVKPPLDPIAKGLSKEQRDALAYAADYGNWHWLIGATLIRIANATERIADAVEREAA